MTYDTQQRSQRQHPPSAYRALMRELKADGDLTLALRRARALDDPYFEALALVTLSERMDPEVGGEIAHEGLDLLKGVDPLWRRAEVTTTIVREIAQNGEGPLREELLERISASILSLENGKGKADAIVGCAPRIGAGRALDLLSAATGNTGHELQSTKAVIKALTKGGTPDEEGTKNILSRLSGIPDPWIRSRLIGFFLQKLTGRAKRDICTSVFNEALEQTSGIEDTDRRIDAFRYLISAISELKDLEQLLDRVTGMKDATARSALMCTLAGRMDRLGDTAKAMELFSSLETEAMVMRDGLQGNHVLLKVAHGYHLCKDPEDAKRIYENVGNRALETGKDGAGILERIMATMEKDGYDVPPRLGEAVAGIREERGREHAVTHPPGTRHVLALFDTYEGGLGPVHLRAVSRAAPLCAAFDLDLVLMGFPADRLDLLVDRVIKDTNIGRGGSILYRLVEEKRVELVPVDREDTRRIREMGSLIATTSHPDPDRSIDLEGTLEKATGKRLVLVMGLGKKGLPAWLLKDVEHHLELTGKNIPLETCTAMGVMAERLKKLMLQQG